MRVDQGKDLELAKGAVAGAANQLRHVGVIGGIVADAFAPVVFAVVGEVAARDAPGQAGQIGAVDVGLDGLDVEVAFEGEEVGGDVPDLAAVADADEVGGGEEDGQAEEEQGESGRDELGEAEDDAEEEGEGAEAEGSSRPSAAGRKDSQRMVAPWQPSRMTVSSEPTPAIWQVGWMSHRLALKASSVWCHGWSGCLGSSAMSRSSSMSLSLARESRANA